MTIDEKLVEEVAEALCHPEPLECQPGHCEDCDGWRSLAKIAVPLIQKDMLEKMMEWTGTFTTRFLDVENKPVISSEAAAEIIRLAAGGDDIYAEARRLQAASEIGIEIERTEKPCQ